MSDAPERAGWFYDLAWLASRSAGTLLWRMRVLGAANVPRSGPIILACNHRAYLDPPLLGSACPRPVTYMAKQELFRVPVLGPAITRLHAFPVDRSRGDVAAIRRGVQALREGRALGIFPEGGRNRTGLPGEPQEGVGLLIKLAGGATVVPAAITGTDRAARLARVTVRFGEPMRFDVAEKASRADVAKWSREIMTRIHALEGDRVDH